ncbi:MAG TPA: hypothetical protein VG963_10210, partial [Polyangiaceae bacterium]|nr:hypothetical protein [Polyangiaceae bacterium]
SFSGMRGLLPAPKRRQRPGRRPRHVPPGLESAGRWALLEAEQAPPADRVERWARLLLRRYGVVFRALLDREDAPPWRDLLREYRRLEARGEVRGGRFVQRHAGEQFAMPEAIPLLRSLRRSEPPGQEVCLSACDPLNLLGTLVPGERVPASPGNFLLFRDGLPIAALEGGRLRPIEAVEESAHARLLARLRRGTLPSAATDPVAGLGARKRPLPAPNSSERAQASS